MGVENNIDYYNFPKQGHYLHKNVAVCFKYDTEKILYGYVVRDDIEKPFITIIRLLDGRHVLATECMYREI